MEHAVAVAALGALANESRLRVFRLLVRRGAEGAAPGEIAAELAIPGSTLSFHLRHLVHAGLVRPERRGRSLRYTLRPEKLNELLWFLGEDCCQGRTDLCAPLTGRIDERMREAATGGERRPKVLFLCTRNSARSQIAEAILRHEAKDRLDVLSGGIRPERVHPLALRVLEEAGIPTRGLEAKDLGRFLGKVPIHYAIVVCETAHEQCPRIWPFARQLLYWPFPDPVAEEGAEKKKLAAFRAVRDAIGARIRSWLSAELPGLERERLEEPAARR